MLKLIMVKNGEKIAILAKHKFYFDDVLTTLKDLKVEVNYFPTIDEFLSRDEKEKKYFKFLFFPHYSKLIPKDIISKYVCIGFHTGNLPSDRGGSPIQNKILRGEYRTYVSALQLTEELDSGPIYCSRSVDLEFGDIESMLRNISIHISTMILEIIQTEIIPKPQNGTSKYYSRLEKCNSEIDLGILNIKTLYDRIRMVDGLDYPPAYIRIDNFKITMRSAQLENDKLKFIGTVEPDSLC
jgi:methionyl-tRNA formyltransferase